MREAGQFVDITLVFGEQRIACHKVILAGMCEYFHRMFLTNMLESESKEVVMEGISATIGCLLVDYIYTGCIKITTQNAQDLLAASEMFFLGSLKLIVEEFLCTHTESTNCVSIINLARIYDMKTLLAGAKKYLYEHVNEVIDTEEVHLLQEEDLVGVLEANGSQEDNFCFLQKWMRSANGRTDRFEHLIKHISLSRCSKEFICSTVMGEELMHSTQGMKLIQQAMQSSGQAKPPDQQSLVHWSTLNPPSFHKFSSVCGSPRGFIISGGSKVEIYKRDCYSYDAHTCQWNTLPPMSIARRSHSSIYHNGLLYIVSGWNEEHVYLNSVETLNLQSLQWYHIAPLPNSRSHSYVVIASNTIFVLGGFKGEHWLGDVFEYDSHRGTWNQRSPMPQICEEGAAVSFHDHIYVVGGRNRSCMQYNPSDDMWTFLQAPRFSHIHGPSLVWNETIVVCGGQDGDSIEAYSPSANEWSPWALRMPIKDRMRFVLKIKSPP
ncbi:hypothetical protein CAPTEDRAFT_136176 [Capitella teleta]|uniref:BTB domain-containing protein n=1 Tax=Capitella teleta TaxID=283909 RepID=R7UJ10_CAPTE|nr:hypothetical protein CAPTEDRAFT_136176 [Capitella teleta]|eukprot:ELU06180.1 hypothetical protein CAPTEDRAFT_136176 [Capitella teleta]